MAVYNQTSINYEFVKVRWQEPYVSSAINRKFFGIFPKGIYTGFVITAVGPRLVNVGPGSVSGGLGTGMTGPGYVSGNYDESVGWSIAVHQDTLGHSSTVAIAPGMLQNYQLNCTGLDGQRVYAVIDVQYSISATTAAQIKLVNGAELDSNPSMVVIGHVDVPANPLTAISSGDIGYDDSSYPRLTPLSTPQRAGLMPASAWDKLNGLFAWQSLLTAERDPGNYFRIQISPSQSVINNKRIFSYIQANLNSKFPRSLSGAYNGGSGNDQLTYIQFSTGSISGAHQINTSFALPSVIGTPNSFQIAFVTLDPADNVNILYGSVYGSRATALLDDNLPVAGKSLFQVAMAVLSTDGSGALNGLSAFDVLDRRPFLNVGGGAGGGSAGSAQYLSDFENSIYNFSLPTDLTVDGTTFIETGASTGSYDLVNGVFNFSAAAQTLVSKNCLSDEFLASSTDLADVSAQVSFLAGSVDTGATYQLSRDGGISYQTVSMARIGSSQDYAGRLIFADTDTISTLSTYVSGNIDSTQPFDSGSNQAIAQVFTTTSTVVPKQATFYVNKVGSPGGTLTIQVVKDSAGSPSTIPTDVLTQSSPITISSLSAGASVLTAPLAGAALPAGTYHLVATVDAVYKASWSSGVNELQLRTDASAPTITAMKQFNGTAWSTVAGEAAPYTLSGRLMDLRLKVTSSAAAKISGFHLMYAPAASVVLPQQQQEIRVFSGDLNTSAFTLANFQPNALTLKVYEPDTGRVFVAPSFSVSGQVVTFPANTFDLPGQTVTLIFDQVAGGVIDQSGVNATNIATNTASISNLQTQINSINAFKGDKNYVVNGDFESNATTSWSLFNTTLTSKIPTGSITSGAASLTTFSVSATNKLAGLYSLRVGSSGAVTAGHGFITDAFTIDREDQAKVLGFSFAYEAVSGTMDFSGTSNNTWAVYVYDVTNSAWIQPAGVYNLVQGSGIGIASGTFQTTSNSTQYRLAVLCITTTSGAVEMRFDDFACGPQKVLQAPAVSDWQSYTPSWFVSSGTQPVIGNGSITGKFRRVGDSYEFQITITSGTTTTYGAGTYNFSIPAAADLSVMPTGTNVGLGTKYRNTPSYPTYLGSVYLSAVNSIALSGDVGANWTDTFPVTLDAATAGHTFRINGTYKGAGLSSNTVSSADTDTRVVGARIGTSGAPTGTIASTVGSSTTIQFNSVTHDTHGSYVAATGYTVPVAGYYSVTAQQAINHTSIAVNNQVTLCVLKNGVLQATGQTLYCASTSVTNYQPLVSDQRFYNSGDIITIRGLSTGTSPVTASDSVGNWLIIQRISGPAVVQASESVSARYTRTTAQSLPDATAPNFVFTTKTYDSHNAYNSSTGVYTVPVSGKYLVKAQVMMDDSTGQYNTVAKNIVLMIYKNGSIVAGYQVRPNGSQYPMVQISDSVSCNAGDTISTPFLNNTGGVTINSFGDGNYCNFYIARIGN